MSIANAFRPRTLSDLLADDVRLARFGRRLIIVSVLLLLGFAVYYTYDRYYVTVESPIDREVRDLENKVRAAPNDVDLRLEVASAYAQQQHYDRAVGQYEEVLKLRQGWSPSLFALASTEEARGNTARAEDLYRQVADKYKDDQYRAATKELQVVYYKLGQFAFKSGRLDEAVTWSQAALGIDGTDSDALYLLGQSLEARGGTAEAESAYLRAASFDPTFQQAFAGVERTGAKQGDTNNAAYAHGMQQYAAGDFQAALSTFQQLTSTAPDFAAGYEGLGLAYAKQNNAAAAMSAFSAALDRDPNRILSQWSLRSLESIQSSEGEK